jgi:hypothetical protein
VRAVLPAILLGVAGVSPAQAAGEEGVWQGTIGTLPIRACLTRDEDGKWGTGSYFYLSKLKPLRLEAADEGPDLVERESLGAEQESARWRVAPKGTDALGGEWRRGARALPIALRRVPATTSDDGPCASDAYLAPRMRPLRVTAAPTTQGTLRYTKLTYSAGPAFPDVTLASFAIAETQPGDKAINAAVRLDPAKPDSPGDYLACVRQGLAQTGTDGDYDAEITPSVVPGDFLSADVSIGWSCGGAHPDNASYSLTYDRRTGREVRLASWLLPSAVTPPGSGDSGHSFRVTPAFRQLLLKRFPFDPQAAECREPVAEEDYWTVAILATGLGFAPQLPHVVQACEDTAVVPFRELAPFLSAAGREGAGRLGYRPAR